MFLNLTVYNVKLYLGVHTKNLNISVSNNINCNMLEELHLP